jgi:phosphoglycerate dehydrogenase-like enzyme
VDEKALVKALQEKEIAGAGLDVFEDEPELAPGLAELDNVVIAPHIASATIETRSKMATMAAEGCLSVLKGEKPVNLVNEEVWDKRRK